MFISHLDHLVLTVADIKKPFVFTVRFWGWRLLHSETTAQH